MEITKMIENQCDAVPEDVGYDSGTILRLDEHLKKIVNSEKYYAGSYLLVKDGKTIASKSMGPRCGYGNEGEFKVDTIRWIASITKTFTAVAIMQLFEEGKLHLHQPVAEIIEEFDNNTHRDITIFHLLTHTSGLPADLGSHFEPYPRWREYDKENWIKQILEGPLANKPGEVWAYCTRGFGFLGEIIARISGMPYDEYIMKKITKPLGMERTFFTIPDELMDEVSFSSLEAEERMKQKGQEGLPSSFYAGGGFLSTALDLAIYGEMLLNKGTYKGVRILSRRSVEAMTRNCLTNVKQYCWGRNGKIIKFGLGFDLNENDILAYGGFSHEGAGRCGICLDPVENLVFVYFVPMYNDTWEWHANTALRAMAWSGLL